MFKLFILLLGGSHLLPLINIQLGVREDCFLPFYVSKNILLINLDYSRVEVAVDVVARSKATRQSHNIGSLEE